MGIVTRLIVEDKMIQIVHIPKDSAPPGHFCWTTCPFVPTGHEIFQSASVSL